MPVQFQFRGFKEFTTGCHFGMEAGMLFMHFSLEPCLFEFSGGESIISGRQCDSFGIDDVTVVGTGTGTVVGIG